MDTQVVELASQQNQVRALSHSHTVDMYTYKILKWHEDDFNFNLFFLGYGNFPNGYGAKVNGETDSSFFKLFLNPT